MGRSTTISCFKIIACGSDSAEKSDLEQTESKTSTDKRGWSFSKRSGRHRVLSNSVVSELPSAGSKENLEAANNDFHEQTNSIVSEKSSVAQWADEIPELAPAEVNEELSAASSVTENDSGLDSNLQESVAIMIQAAIRGYLAQRALFKHKTAVKLQAAVRGHLVRRQAIGTLRCVQAIVKMQALVRARRVRLSAVGLGIQEELGENIKTNNQRVNSLERENLGAEANMTYSSSQKLITNGFARQLLNSTPKKKRVHITCDPSKPDSAWKWLERWMSVSSLDIAQQPKPHVELECQDQVDAKLAASEVGTEVEVRDISDSADSNSVIKEAEILFEGEDQLVQKNADDSEFQFCKQTEVLGKSSSSETTDEIEQPVIEISSSVTEVGIGQPLDKSSSSAMKDDIEQPQIADLGLKEELSNGKVLNEAPDSLSNQKAIQSKATSVTMLDSVPDMLEVDRENSKQTMKRVASEQLETEGKKFVFGSRKSAANPAFAAVQSKFEELSSTGNSGRRPSSISLEVAVDSKLDSHSPQMDSGTKNKDLTLTQVSVSLDQRIQVGGSECGTELSVSSTLNSPDRSGAEGVEFLPETGTAYQGDSYQNGIPDDISGHKNLDAEAKKPTSMLEEVLTTPADPGFVMSGNIDDVNKKLSDSAEDVDSNKEKQQQPSENIKLTSENIVSDVHIVPVMDQAMDILSQGGTPRSHITAPDSRGTPSSQVSLNTKGDKKRKSHSDSRRSLSQQNNDSAVSSSIEHLPKDPKIGKKRNSFDHEPRVSSSNSLPSYMQPTESARAKVYTSNSPKSSPDMQDKEIYIKKRHSLPAVNGMQVSPRMQRSLSQAQQSAKGNGTHSPQNATGNF
ncbi:hypothetical protein MRB53_000958 [Persea americana]|uniref:Uncharacterized protein n=1 Tax=Persea americana TaxID=3435 RepID=A0ACC2MQC8_PERAE|nr:hypothetical protein MRB53_000958 [Persea americana]